VGTPTECYLEIVERCVQARRWRLVLVLKWYANAKRTVLAIRMSRCENRTLPEVWCVQRSQAPDAGTFMVSTRLPLHLEFGLLYVQGQ
jgi:hypothetical protein